MRRLLQLALVAVALLGMTPATRATPVRDKRPQQNSPPVAAFTVEPTSGVVGTIFYFDPTGSHDDEDSLAWLLVRFDWTGDGIYDTTWLNPANPFPRHDYEAVGTYTVRMIVKDRDGLTDTDEHTVVVGDPGNNTPPTARCTVTPAEGSVDTVFTYSAATSSDEQDGVGDLIARWDWFDAGQWTTPWGPATQALTHQFDRHGLHTVRLEVRDTGMLSDETDCTVEVLPEEPNTAPTASFTISPPSGDTTTLFTLDPTSSTDKEDGIAWLQARYDWTDDGTYDTLWMNASQTTQRVFREWGHLTVRMQIRDTGGLSDETTRTVDIEPFTFYLPVLTR